MSASRLALLAVLSASLAYGADAADLSGTVRGPDGSAVAGALVAAVASNAPAPAAIVRTDAAGAFRITGLPNGRYGLTVTARGLEGAYRGGLNVGDAGASPALTISLRKAGWTLRGSVAAGRDGRPVPAARIFASRFSDEDADLFVAEVGPDGRFEVALPDAEYGVAALAEGFESESARVKSGDAKPLVLWLDSLEELRSPPPEGVLSALRKAAVPLATVEAGHGFVDMAPLAKFVGTARIVALGESTHGTKEFFQLKHRMLEYLVSELGFTVFAIEAAQPEARAVDRWVTTGEGDPAKALSGLHFWTWDTVEVLEMIRWMRHWNEDPAHTRKVRFAGFDMQFTAVAEAAVRDFLRPVDPAWSAALAKSLALLRRPAIRTEWPKLEAAQKAELARAVAALGNALDERRQALVGRSSPAAFDDARHDARILAQFLELVQQPGTLEVRDRAMAENAAWLLEHAGAGARMVVWAHNGHVSRNPASPLGTSMGAALSHRFGEDYRAFGLMFSEGAFQAIGDGSLRDFTVSPAPTGTLDAALASTGLPRFALDLASFSGGSPAAAWLERPRKTRSIGALYDEKAPERFFARQALPREFDALLFVAKTTAARPNAPPVNRPPPALAAVNLGFEDGPTAGAPAGWTLQKTSAEDGWNVTVSTDKPREGGFAARIARGRTDPPSVPGILMQRIDATPWRGKRILLRAAVRVESADTAGQAQLWLRVDRLRAPIGFFDNMEDRPIRDPEWRMYEISGDVAPDAEAIAFGLILQSGGMAFLDAVSLTEGPPK